MTKLLTWVTYIEYLFLPGGSGNGHSRLQENRSIVSGATLIYLEAAYTTCRSSSIHHSLVYTMDRRRCLCLIGLVSTLDA
jgi:hypothetical protein